MKASLSFLILATVSMLVSSCNLKNTSSAGGGAYKTYSGRIERIPLSVDDMTQ